LQKPSGGVWEGPSGFFDEKSRKVLSVFRGTVPLVYQKGVFLEGVGELQKKLSNAVLG